LVPEKNAAAAVSRGGETPVYPLVFFFSPPKRLQPEPRGSKSRFVKPLNYFTRDTISCKRG
jgi:hypothetical protein